uniref:Uncharacterized protein n=1 Tax=Mustela putorius furo TaxID=9669 RepID=M3XMT8_MUSPF
MDLGKKALVYNIVTQQFYRLLGAHQEEGEGEKKRSKRRRRKKKDGRRRRKKKREKSLPNGLSMSKY